MTTIAHDGDRDIDAPSDRITATIAEFQRISGIGRSRIYELIAAGELESVHLGVRRLILIDSYRRLLARLRAAATETRGREPPMGRLVSAEATRAASR